MALIIGLDVIGPFVEIRCERRGCWSAIGIRPEVDADTPAIAGRDLIELADSLGWVLTGETWCPRHARHRPRRRTPVGDGFAWAHVEVEPVKGAERRSGPLTGGRPN